jgi:polyisoprenoid-binding protein YceI
MTPKSEKLARKKEMKMSKHVAVLSVAVVFALGILAIGAKKPASVAGLWEVDARHSDAQLTTDGTTDYGRSKINIVLGVARVNGELKFDDGDASKSRVDLHIYPATAMSPSIDDEGRFSKKRWLADQANHTILCFHAKSVERLADGRLQTKGELSVVRVDRNVELNPNEAYYGPVYGPPIIHRDSREATFVFDAPADGQKAGQLDLSASTKVFKEDFPQLVKTVASTYWPPVVQDENCRVPAPSEAYSGAKCTGTFLQTPGLPEEPHAASGTDIGSNQNFNTLVGERVDVVVHMRLTPGSGGMMASGE